MAKKYAPFRNLRSLISGRMHATKRLRDLKVAILCIRKKLLFLSVQNLQILYDYVVKLGWRTKQKLSWAVRAMEDRICALELVRT